MENKEKSKADKVSKVQSQGALVFMTVFFISQMAFSTMWAGGLTKIDLMQLVIAPTCCFTVAAIFGWFRNPLTTVVSSLWIFPLGSIFYALFQLMTFFRESTLENILKMNFSVMGVQTICATLIAALIFAFIRFFDSKKNNKM